MLDELEERRHVVRFERRPGQKEARWGLSGPFAGGDEPVGSEPPEAAPTPYVAPVREPAAADRLAARVDALEAELRELRAVVAQLRELLD